MKKSSSKLLVLLVWTCYRIAYKLYYPIFTNSQALKQFENNNNSFIAYQTQLLIWQNAWKFLIFISILILILPYKKEIKLLLKKD